MPPWLNWTATQSGSCPTNLQTLNWSRHWRRFGKMPNCARRLGGRGQEIIADKHNPLRCAALYHEAIERFSVTASASVARDLASDLASLNHKLEERVLTEISSAVARNMPRPFKARQLLVDISAVVLRDLRTGIQRVVRGIIHELLTTPPSGFRVEPVYATKYGCLSLCAPVHA